MLRCLQLLGLMMALLPSLASALEYRAVSVPKATLYDAPSAQGKKIFLLGQGYPVEVIVNLGEWVKVRDRQGALSWVESRQLSTKRTVLVIAEESEVRQAGEAAAAIVFRAQKDVTLELLEAPVNGWAKVRHRDGLSGYIAASAVWGL